MAAIHAIRKNLELAGKLTGKLDPRSSETGNLQINVVYTSAASGEETTRHVDTSLKETFQKISHATSPVRFSSTTQQEVNMLSIFKSCSVVFALAWELPNQTLAP